MAAGTVERLETRMKNKNLQQCLLGSQNHSIISLDPKPRLRSQSSRGSAGKPLHGLSYWDVHHIFRKVSYGVLE